MIEEVKKKYNFCKNKIINFTKSLLPKLLIILWLIYIFSTFIWMFYGPKNIYNLIPLHTVENLFKDISIRKYLGIAVFLLSIGVILTEFTLVKEKKAFLRFYNNIIFCSILYVMNEQYNNSNNKNLYYEWIFILLLIIILIIVVLYFFEIIPKAEKKSLKLSLLIIFYVWWVNIERWEFVALLVTIINNFISYEIRYILFDNPVEDEQIKNETKKKIETYKIFTNIFILLFYLYLSFADFIEPYFYCILNLVLNLDFTKETSILNKFIYFGSFKTVILGFIILFIWEKREKFFELIKAFLKKLFSDDFEQKHKKSIENI